MKTPAELFSLKGKVAVVIGGTGVLCGEMAEGIAIAGATVALVGRDAAKAKDRLDKIAKGGGNRFAAIARGRFEKIRACGHSGERRGHQFTDAVFRYSGR